MKDSTFKRLYSLLLVLAALTLGGCDFVGDVLEFGFWSIVIIIAILVLIIYLISRIFR